MELEFANMFQIINMQQLTLNSTLKKQYNLCMPHCYAN